MSGMKNYTLDTKPQLQNCSTEKSRFKKFGKKKTPKPQNNFPFKKLLKSYHDWSLKMFKKEIGLLDYCAVLQLAGLTRFSFLRIGLKKKRTSN